MKGEATGRSNNDTILANSIALGFSNERRTAGRLRIMPCYIVTVSISISNNSLSGYCHVHIVLSYLASGIAWCQGVRICTQMLSRLHYGGKIIHFHLSFIFHSSMRGLKGFHSWEHDPSIDLALRCHLALPSHPGIWILSKMPIDLLLIFR